jgi:hypothetical protein
VSAKTAFLLTPLGFGRLVVLPGLLAGNLGLSHEPLAFVQCLLQQLIDLPELGDLFVVVLATHLPPSRSKKGAAHCAEPPCAEVHPSLGGLMQRVQNAETR